jgi:dCTP diphosphatase
MSSSPLDDSEPIDSLKQLMGTVRAFNEARAWSRFHTPKNIASAMCVEAGELLRIFQWQVDDEPRLPLEAAQMGEVRSEIADIAMYLFTLCSVVGVDLGEAVTEKLAINSERYPEVGYSGAWRERRRVD